MTASPLTPRVLRFEVRGRPRPQGSVNYGRDGRAYPAARGLREWRTTVAQHAQIAMWENPRVRFADDEAVRVVCQFRYRRPTSHFRTERGHRLLRNDAPTAKATAPDIDKLARAVLDALTISGIIHDDRQVASLTAEKAYGTDDLVEVAVRALHWEPTVAYAQALT